MSARAGFTAIGLVVIGLASLTAQEAPQSPAAAEAFEATLEYQTGNVTLRGGLATIDLPETFRFLTPESSRKLLTDGWGNPAGAAKGVLGMLVPADLSPLSDEGWGIVITYEEDGYVDDEDAAKLNYDELLANMQEESREVNKAREEQGFPAVDLVGWAEPPHYDATTHKLYWAKELAFADSDTHTLNYNIRVLGRRGVLVLNAVSNMEQLDAIRAGTEDVMAAVSFNEGHRYTDYIPGTDKAATYGVAGLIAGASAAKAGLFKALFAGLLAFKKVIAGAVIAGFALLKKMLTRSDAATA